jgi:hypothetical protein
MAVSAPVTGLIVYPETFLPIFATQANLPLGSTATEFGCAPAGKGEPAIHAPVTGLIV